MCLGLISGPIVHSNIAFGIAHPSFKNPFPCGTLGHLRPASSHILTTDKEISYPCVLSKDVPEVASWFEKPCCSLDEDIRAPLNRAQLSDGRTRRIDQKTPLHNLPSNMGMVVLMVFS
jgi:hypothetical protein